jgi:beta-N-acetylhexosaminidase
MRRPLRAAVLGAVLSVLAACGGGTGPRATTPSSSTAPSSPTTAAPTSATPSGPDAVVAAALARMDTRAKVAQLFVVGVPLTNLGSGDALVQQGVGGLFLAGRSTISATALAQTTGRWVGEAPGPKPWISTDMEGGQVQTLSGPGFGRFPSAVAQGQLPPEQLAAVAGDLGAALHSAGITLDLAPVADVVPAGTERSNAPIGFFDRQYGSTPAQVEAAAGAVVDGLAAHQVTATVKHFPGLGRVTANTDTTAGVTDTVTTANDPSVTLFGSLAARPAAPMVMVSLAIYSQIDGSQPAAFSPAVVTGVLRQQLHYAGPVISDDLGMAKAVTAVAPGDRATRFIAAGGTLVLTVVPSLLGQMIDAVVGRAAADQAFAAQVDAAVRTDLLAKVRAGLLTG